MRGERTPVALFPRHVIAKRSAIIRVRFKNKGPKTRIEPIAFIWKSALRMAPTTQRRTVEAVRRQRTFARVASWGRAVS